MVKLLLGAKADANVKNQGGGTALYFAAEKGYAEVMKLLLEQKTDLVSRERALWIAASEGHTEIVKLLLEAKAGVNAQVKDGWTALMTAPWKRDNDGLLKVVKWLVEEENADVNPKDLLGTVLHYAA